MKIVERTNCVMCNSTELSPSHNIPQFPIYMGTTNRPQVEDLYHDMIFAKCELCDSIQLKELIPLDILYKESHTGIIGATWASHHAQFCTFAEKYAHGVVVEIGGSNLAVANRLSSSEKIDSIMVFDNQIYMENIKSEKIILREEFFDVKNVPSSVSCVMHTHLIEHLYKPIEEFKKIHEAMPDNGYMLFAAPLIGRMLKRYFTNAMNFEHTYLLTEAKIDEMMTTSGFTLVEKEYFSEYAAFYAYKKTASAKKSDLKKHPEDVKIINNFVGHYLNEVKKIQAQINSSPEKTFIFGAHIFTQYLLSFGLNEKHFCNILDNDPKKIGNRLYGTDLIVQSPKILKDVEKPTVVLKAAQYTEEIKKDIIENINPNTRFIL